MVSKVVTATFATIFAFAGASAFAQEWDWTPDREHGFYDRYSVRPDPRPGLSFTLGAAVPEDIELYDTPDFDYAPAKKYRYVTVQKKVYVVEPKSRKVIRIIEK